MSPVPTAPVAQPFPGEPPVTPALVREHKLNDQEYREILAMLGRTPTLTEVSVDELIIPLLAISRFPIACTSRLPALPDLARFSRVP